MIKHLKRLLNQVGKIIERRVLALKDALLPAQRHLKSNKKESEELEKSRLANKKISNELYVAVEFDELEGIVYLMLNRTSFAITLEEFAKLSSSISEAYIALIEHPNIVLTSAQDEITKEETEEFIYVSGHNDEFVN
jgi:hypothetical protein